MSTLSKLESFLSMEAQAASVIDACLLPDGTPYWPMLRVLYNHCFAYGDHQRYANMLAGQGTIVQCAFSLPPATRASLQSIPRGGCAYFSRSVCTVLSVQGRKFDPYLDPVAFVAQKWGVSPVKFTLATNTHMPYCIEPVAIPYESEWHPVSIKQVGIYAGYKGYIECSLEHRVPILPFADIAQTVVEITAYCSLFTEILSAMQPSMVILEEYYNDMAQGIALACHQLGIPCAEYQHGLQTPPHIPYNFQYIPPNGYPSVPEWFFVWGEKDEQRYQKSFAYQNYHKVAVVGKPDYLAWKMGRLPDDPALLERLRTTVAGKKVICVPLQGPNYPIPLLEECIQQSPADWVWLLRDHPISPPVAATLVAKYPDRTEAIAATTLNLHTVLSFSHHMVFGQSSTAFEAIALHNMRATILDSVGTKFYAEALAEGDISYADTVTFALQTIYAALDKYPNTSIKDQYITRDESKLGNIIKLLSLQWKAQHIHA